jgi:hypothetical protein
LYFCHRFDPDTSIDEVLFTMDMLVRQGKILYWGTSEWRAWQITAAFLSAKDNHLIPPVVEQPQYNMFHRQRVEVELEQICKDYGIGLTTWSPLYYGILTGKYNDGIPQDSRAALDGMAGYVTASPRSVLVWCAPWQKLPMTCTSAPGSWPLPGCCAERKSAASSLVRHAPTNCLKISPPPKQWFSFLKKCWNALKRCWEITRTKIDPTPDEKTAPRVERRFSFRQENNYAAGGSSSPK